MTHEVFPQDEAARTLERQKAALLADGVPSVASRRDRLARLLAMTVEGRERIVEAIRADSDGQRSPREIAMMDLLSTVTALKHARARVRRWMRPERRQSLFPFGLFGASSRVEHVPKGVVGVVSPWNVPYGLAVGPAIGAIAAGNRVMLKPSEHTPATSQLLRDLVARYFDEAEVAVVTGGPEVAAAFTRLPFDHLVFTGSTAIGRHVLGAAADNLVPTTLELGGKSPVILGTSAAMDKAVDAIVLGKMLNAGQVCIAPDYVLVPRELEQAFVLRAAEAARRLFPDPAGNPDYSAIISAAKHERLAAIVADARAKGARVTVVGEEGAPTVSRRMPLHILQGVDDTMRAMREEVFGPILPVIGVESVRDAIGFVNARETPLALYYFGADAAEKDEVVARTRSGGVTINDTHHHILQEDLPFGGVGHSGMGYYHGHAGFLEFSHRRAVFEQARVDLTAMVGLKPPYTAKFDRFLRMKIR